MKRFDTIAYLLDTKLCVMPGINDSTVYPVLVSKHEVRNICEGSEKPFGVAAFTDLGIYGYTGTHGGVTVYNPDTTERVLRIPPPPGGCLKWAGHSGNYAVSILREVVPGTPFVVRQCDLATGYTQVYRLFPDPQEIDLEDISTIKLGTLKHKGSLPTVVLYITYLCLADEIHAVAPLDRVDDYALTRIDYTEDQWAVFENEYLWPEGELRFPTVKESRPVSGIRKYVNRVRRRLSVIWSNEE